MASQMKRPRESGMANGSPLLTWTVASPRSRLFRRIDETPPFWTDIARRFGTTGADAGLCALGREVADVIRSVGASADAERQRLESLRKTLHVAIDIRIDELLGTVASAESSKVAALERELEQLDAALERTRRENAAAREALTSKSDDEIAALSVALTASLDGIDTLLATLPHGPIEPSLLRLELDEGALLSWVRTAGAVLAPRHICAADIVVRAIPSHVRPGCPLQFELALADDYPCRAPAELEAAAASLAFHARVDVSLERGAELHQVLNADCAWTRGGFVTVTVAAPETASCGSDFVVNCVTVRGQTVMGAGGLVPSCRTHVASFIYGPRVIHEGGGGGIPTTPVFTLDGKLLVPSHGSANVLAFAWDGTPLPPLPLHSVGLPPTVTWAAFVAATGTLLLADGPGGGSLKLVAVDASTGTARWSTIAGHVSHGIAALPSQGVFVVTDAANGQLHVHRLSDGARVSSTVPGAAKAASFVASDAASGTVFVNTGTPPEVYQTAAFRWSGAALEADGVVEAAGLCAVKRPLAVIPPPRGMRTSYLVVGDRFAMTPNLLVFSLPDRRLLHTHVLLEDTKVDGLAADPCGAAIAVWDAASRAVHVLPWPLPGMLPLQ
jgi:hypothetical protein